MAVMNVKYTEIEFCSIVLSAVYLCTSMVFYASAQNKIPTDITVLTSSTVDQGLQPE